MARFAISCSDDILFFESFKDFKHFNGSTAAFGRSLIKLPERFRVSRRVNLWRFSNLWMRFSDKSNSRSLVSESRFSILEMKW